MSSARQIRRDLTIAALACAGLGGIAGAVALEGKPDTATAILAALCWWLTGVATGILAGLTWWSHVEGKT